MSMTHGISGYVLKCRCTVCKAETLDYKRARNERIYKAGRCRHCTEPRQPKRVMCGLCLADARDYQRERKARRQTQEAA